MPYFVYIMTNQRNTVLYTGSTSDLGKRVSEHKTRIITGFTSKYNVDKLVYYESFESRSDARMREKQLKRYQRQWKENLIHAQNPQWSDLLDLG